jgi:hypothetical protein
MDRHAHRAIVNGAGHGDSVLVSADQLMAASRRDHPLMSVSAEPQGSQGYKSRNRLIPETSAGRRRTAIRLGDRPAGWRFPAATRRTGERGSAGSRDAFQTPPCAPSGPSITTTSRSGPQKPTRRRIATRITCSVFKIAQNAEYFAPHVGLLRRSWARRSSSSEWTRSLAAATCEWGANVRSAVAGPGSFRP